jgi:antitoxin PrlF
MMQQPTTSKYIPSTITSKGQVTIPADVRRYLGVDKNDKIAFEITPKGEVLLTRYPTLAELKGSLGKLPNSLSWKEIREIAHDDLAEAIMRKG